MGQVNLTECPIYTVKEVPLSAFVNLGLSGGKTYDLVLIEVCRGYGVALCLRRFVKKRCHIAASSRCLTITDVAQAHCDPYATRSSDQGPNLLSCTLGGGVTRITFKRKDSKSGVACRWPFRVK